MHAKNKEKKLSLLVYDGKAQNYAVFRFLQFSRSSKSDDGKPFFLWLHFFPCPHPASMSPK